MNELLSQIQKNGSFLLITAAIIVVIGLLARLTERKFDHLRHVSPARRVSIIGICSAIAVVLHILDFPLVFLAPEFYKLDFSEVPVLLGGFFLGPSAAVAIEGIKILLKLLLKSTSTAFVGDFANFFVGCCFVLPATVWYHLHKNKTGAIVGLVIGTLTMTVIGSVFNAWYLLPKFAQLYGIPLDVIIGMGAKIHSGITGVYSFAALCVAPLNLLKGTVVSLLTMLLYKRVARPLFRIHELPAGSENP